MTSDNIKQDDLREKRVHSSVQTPYSIYDCRIPDSFPSVPMHWHPEFEIDYILDGYGEAYVDSEKFPVRKGDVIFILPNQLHADYPLPIENDKKIKLHYLALVFHESMIRSEMIDRSSAEYIEPLINRQLQVNSFYSRTHPDYLQIRHLTRQIMDCALENEAKSDLLLKSYLLQLIWMLEKSENIKPNSQHGNNAELIRPAMEYMKENYRIKITIPELAQICSVSPSHFMNIFKNVVGYSAITYLNDLRIHEACIMLDTTNLSIGTVAEQCGFSNLSNFNRQFHSFTGKTPREYRGRI